MQVSEIQKEAVNFVAALGAATVTATISQIAALLCGKRICYPQTCGSVFRYLMTNRMFGLPRRSEETDILDLTSKVHLEVVRKLTLGQQKLGFRLS